MHAGAIVRSTVEAARACAYMASNAPVSITVHSVRSCGRVGADLMHIHEQLVLHKLGGLVEAWKRRFVAVRDEWNTGTLKLPADGRHDACPDELDACL